MLTATIVTCTLFCTQCNVRFSLIPLMEGCLFLQELWDRGLHIHATLATLWVAPQVLPVCLMGSGVDLFQYAVLVSASLSHQSSCMTCVLLIFQTVLCPTLPPPLNGRVSASGGTATYTCNTGYTLNSSAQRNCQSNGQWSGTAPSCNPSKPHLPRIVAQLIHPLPTQFLVLSSVLEVKLTWTTR